MTTLGGLICLIGACSTHDGRAPALEPTSPLRPLASLQELMQGLIDPSADGVWNAVETITTASGTATRQPQTPEEWLGVRHAAVILAEGANLLVIEGRRAGAQDFPAEAAGALDSAHIQELIAAKRPTFNAFAAALRETALTAVSAIDARNPAQLVSAGGAIDQVCESCHLAFWYPNQVIPALPKSVVHLGHL
jgi:hypothetical protein